MMLQINSVSKKRQKKSIDRNDLEEETHRKSGERGII